MINFDKLTNYSQEILSSASALMNAKHNTQIEPEHIMLAMIQDNGISRDYLTELKLLNQNFINAITKAVSDFPTISGVQNTQQLFLSNNTSKLKFSTYLLIVCKRNLPCLYKGVNDEMQITFGISNLSFFSSSKISSSLNVVFLL